MNNMIANALAGIASKAIGGNDNQAVVNTALQVYNSLKGNGEYMSALQSMAPTNPLIAKALDYIKQNGGDSSKAFYELASKSGIDPNTVLGMIKK